MYNETDVDIRNRDNVRNNGEVFTPTPIVDAMNNLIPESAWTDKEFVFIEPTCEMGNSLLVFLRNVLPMAYPLKKP